MICKEGEFIRCNQILNMGSSSFQSKKTYSFVLSG